MAKNEGKTREIRGWQFRTAKNGLDQDDVSSFIDNLTSQHDDLTERLHDVDSLIHLAENTIVEAGKQAKTIEAEIEEEARVKAASLIAEAEEKARADVERLLDEVRENARAETASIHEEAEQLGVATRQKVENEIKQAFEAVCADIFAGKYSGETPETVVIDAQSERESVDEVDTTLIETTDTTTQETFDHLDQDSQVDEIEDECVPATIVEQNDLEAQAAPDEAFVVEAAYQPDESASAELEDDLTPPPDDGDASADELCQGHVELRIPPPIALDRVLRMHRELKENPQIDVRSFAVSAEDGVKVELSLPSAMPLISILESIPGVTDVTSMPDTRSKNSKRRKGDAPVLTVLQVTVA